MVSRIVWKAFQEGCARCDGACVWTFVKFLELLKGCAPGVCGVEEGWGDGWEGHCCGLCDGDTGGDMGGI